MEEVMEDLDQTEDNVIKGQKKRKRVEIRIGELKGHIKNTKRIVDTL